MGRPIYSAITSLDGYIADEDGKFEWGEPGEDMHQFVNDLERPIGIGRRLYELMSVWEGMNTLDQPPYVRDFAEIWQAAEKVVYSRTLESVSTART
jgi:dihydrofolate reductase